MKTKRQIEKKIMYLESFGDTYTKAKRPTPESVISMIQALYWVIEE